MTSGYDKELGSICNIPIEYLFELDMYKWGEFRVTAGEIYRSEFDDANEFIRSKLTRKA